MCLCDVVKEDQESYGHVLMGDDEDEKGNYLPLHLLNKFMKKSVKCVHVRDSPSFLPLFLSFPEVEVCFFLFFLARCFWVSFSPFSR